MKRVSVWLVVLCAACAPLRLVERPTVNAIIVNQTAVAVQVFVERCGFSERLIGEVPPFRADTFNISSGVIPFGSAVTFHAHTSRQGPHFYSRVLALPAQPRRAIRVTWVVREPIERRSQTR